MRRSGQTTVLVDNAIQTLFMTGLIFIPTPNTIKDNFRKLQGTNIHPYKQPNMSCIFIDGEGTFREQEHFLKVFCKRLAFEHNLYVNSKRLPLDTLIYLNELKQTGKEYKKLNWFQLLKFKITGKL